VVRKACHATALTGIVQAAWADYQEGEHKYLSFWRTWYEEVGKAATEEPKAEPKN
jgi:hypothetical protein